MPEGQAYRSDTNDKWMSESDIKLKLEELISGGASSIGDIMKGFNGLQVDKKKVSVIYQSLK